MSKVIQSIGEIIKGLLSILLGPSEDTLRKELTHVSNSFPFIAEKMEIPEEYKENVERLHFSIYLELKKMFPSIVILSWYRSKKLNVLVGGVENSDHTYGAALDFWVPGTSTKSIFLSPLVRALPYRQLIYYPKQGFIHISINHPDKKEKKEVKTNA